MRSSGSKRSIEEKLKNPRAEETLSDGTRAKRVGASWHLVDEDGEPYGDRGFHSFTHHDDNTFIANSGGAFGTWAKLSIESGELEVLQEFKGTTANGKAPTAKNERRFSLYRLGVLTPFYRVRVWCTRLMWCSFMFVMLSAMGRILSVFSVALTVGLVATLGWVVATVLHNLTFDGFRWELT